jgi:hypothetical protein
MRSVADYQSGMVSERDTSNQSSYHADHPAGLSFAEARSSPRLLRSSIEWSNSVSDLLENGFERFHQQRSSLSGRQDLQPESNLQNCH